MISLRDHKIQNSLSWVIVEYWCRVTKRIFHWRFITHTTIHMLFELWCTFNKVTVQLWSRFVDLVWIPYQVGLAQATGHRWCESMNAQSVSPGMLDGFHREHIIEIVTLTVVLIATKFLWQCKSGLKGWKSLPASNCLTKDFFAPRE